LLVEIDKDKSMGVEHSKVGGSCKEEMSVYIVTVPNIIQFATWGGSGRSFVEGNIVCNIEGRGGIL